MKRTLFIFWTRMATPLYGNPTIYNEPVFLSRAMTRFPLTTFHYWFPNFTSCPCSSNCLIEIKLFVKLGTTLTSFKVQKSIGVFNTMLPMAVTSRVLLSTSLTFPKSRITRICNASLLWVAWMKHQNPWPRNPHYYLRNRLRGPRSRSLLQCWLVYHMGIDSWNAPPPCSSNMLHLSNLESLTDSFWSCSHYLRYFLPLKSESIISRWTGNCDNRSGPTVRQRQ